MSSCIHQLSASTMARRVEGHQPQASPSKRMRREDNREELNTVSDSIQASISRHLNNSLTGQNLTHRTSTMIGPRPEVGGARSLEPPPVLTPFHMPSQTTGKRPRGRPRDTDAGQGRPTQSTTASHVTSAEHQSAKRYVADGNPQYKSRLSENSRLSRSNISLSREQEKALLTNNKDESNATKRKKKKKNKKKNRDSDDSSGWDSDTQLFDVSDRRNRQSSTIRSKTDSPRKSQTNSPRSQTIQNNRCDDLNGQIVESTPVTSAHSIPLSTTITRVDETSVENVNVNVEAGHPIPVGPQAFLTSATTSTSISEWLFHTKPKKFPYFPQIGDELIYIPYGHKLYLEAVRVLNLFHSYTIKQAKDQSDVIYCRVKQIDFEKSVNVRYAKLSLALIDPHSDAELSKRITVKFHDIDNVLDFLILRQTYEKSLALNWKPGDYFRAIVEDKWWVGNIKDYNVNDNNMTTHFQGLNIVWPNGVTEQLSFWDLERVRGLIPQNKSDPIDVTDEDRQMFYEPSSEDWPPFGKAEDCKRIANGLIQIMQINEYKELMQVFNRENIEYTATVPYPIDLNIIYKRTRNLFYRRQAAIKYDIKFLLRNATALESKYPNIKVVENALMVLAVCFRFIDDKATDANQIYSTIQKADLKKYKFYSCVRHYLNPSASNRSSLTENNFNLFIPSTSNPIVQSRDANSTEVLVIDLLDSDDNDNNNNNNINNNEKEDNNEVEVEDEDEAQSPEERVQNIVNSMESHLITDRAPDSPESHTNVEQVSSIRVSPSRTVRKTPIEKPQPKPTQPVIPVARVQEHSFQNRYFCFRCETLMATREQAYDHYLEEFSMELECKQCPHRKFQSLEEYRSHSGSHILSMKLDNNAYETGIKWINKMLNYMERVNDPSQEIDQKFGDYCVVCKRLNLMTPHSQPFYNDNFFKGKRMQIHSSEKMHDQLLSHMKRHMQYNPVFTCQLCELQKVPADRVFTTKSVDQKCCQHFETEHQMPHPVGKEQISNLFVSSEITMLKDLIRHTRNMFVLKEVPF